MEYLNPLLPLIHLTQFLTYQPICSTTQIIFRIIDIANMFRGAERKNSQQLRFEEFVPSSTWIEESDTHCLIIDLPGFKRNEMNLKVDDNRHIVACGERQVNEYKRIRFEQSYKVPENSNIDDITAKFEDEILFIVIPKIIKAQKEPHPEITNVPEVVQEEKGTVLNNVVDKVVPQEVLKKEEEEVKDNDQITDAAANGSRHESDSHNHHGNEELSDEESEEEDDDTVKEEEEEETTTTTEEEDFHDPKMENHCSLMEKLGKKLKKNKGILITAVLAFSLGIIVSQKFQPSEK